jgi:cell division protease FtsH
LSDMAKNLIVWLIIAVVLMSVFNSFGPNESADRQTSYTQFIKEVNQGQISEVKIERNGVITGLRSSGERFETVLPVNDPQLMADLLENDVRVLGAKPEENSWLATIFISWFPMLLLIGGFSLCDKCRAAVAKVPCRSVKAKRVCWAKTR